MTKTLHKLNPYLELGVIFGLALFLRMAFNLTLENRLCHWGDAYYFLMSGAQLLAACKTGLLAHVNQLHPTAGVAAMTSLNLVDRLLTDGPVFPAYLAMVQSLIGLNPTAPQFDTFALQISFFNSLLDAIACALIYQTARLAFTRRAGQIAGLMAALYPAAIINTSSCYSEPFAYFTVAVFLSVLLANQLRVKNAFVGYTLAVALGMSATLLMLAKPVFVILPALLAAITLAFGGRIGTKRIIVAIVASLITMTPWLAFTGLVTGKPSIVVNRYPAYNFMMGNRIECDGWRVYPLPYVPTDMKEALQIIGTQAKEQPAQFIAMQLRKVIRLWAGSWNNFELSFILSPTAQDAVHSFLLITAILGVIFSTDRHRLRSRIGRSTLVLAAVPLFHCIYVIFEPQSRYAFPAMAAVIPLAAFALSTRPRFPQSALSRTLLAATCLTFIVIAAAEFNFRPNRYERKIPKTTVARAFNLSESEITDGYILFDANPITNFAVTINGTQLDSPIPTWQLVKEKDELLNAMSAQSSGMSKPISHFRQWYAYRVPRALLRAGANTIQATRNGPGTMYGDSAEAFANAKAWLPSLQTGSWTQAFTTIYRGEPRVYESLKFSGTAQPRTTIPRLFFTPAASAINDAKPFDFQATNAKCINGADPTTYTLTPKPIPVRDNPAHFRFSAHVAAPKPTNAYASIQFSATVEGKRKEWVSPWQPTSVPVTQQDMHWVVQDHLPADIAHAPDASASIMASPFSADLLFRNKKQALKRAIVIKNAHLELFPQGAFPPLAEPFELR